MGMSARPKENNFGRSLYLNSWQTGTSVINLKSEINYRSFAFVDFLFKLTMTQLAFITKNTMAPCYNSWLLYYVVFDDTCPCIANFI